MSTIFRKLSQWYNCSSVDVPLDEHVTLQLPFQVVMIPPQDLVGDVEAVVVVKLTSGEVEVPVEIATLCHPECGWEWCRQFPRLNNSCNNVTIKLELHLESSIGMLENLCT